MADTQRTIVQDLVSAPEGQWQADHERSRCLPERHPGRSEGQESERFRRYAYDELMGRYKVNLDLFWLRDDSLEDIDNLPPPAVLAAEIAEDLQTALAEIQALTDSLAAIADAASGTEAPN